MSQIAGKDLGQTEPLLLKLTEGKLTEAQELYMKQVFAQLCRLCFPKKVWDQLDPKFHSYMQQSEQGGATSGSAQTQDQHMSTADEPELQLITDALLAKESSERLLEVIQNGSVFIHAILNRTKKSLEHLKTSVERYKKVFDELFQGSEGQQQIIEQVIVVFLGKRTGDDYDKILKVLQKLCQINCISNQSTIQWALNSINNKSDQASAEDVRLEFDIICQALQRESSQKWLTVTLFQ